jgi:hypothetical protein
MQPELIWMFIYMSFIPCSFYCCLMCRSIVKPSLVCMISLKSRALEKFPYGNSRMLYPLTYIRSVRINLLRLVFIDNGGVFWVHVQGNNNNVSTSLEFFFKIEHSCLLNSKSSCFLYTEKVLYNNWCCCQAVLWRGARPKLEVDIQNINAHGESHGHVKKEHLIAFTKHLQVCDPSLGP